MKNLISFYIAILLTLQTFPQNERQTANIFEKEVRINISANYLLYLPKDYNKSENSFPLVLFLHGSGERGNDLEKVKIHGLPKLINEGKDFPFIVVSPQCPDEIFWNTEVLAALLDKIENEYRVDKNKIYITGLSMGGYGTWSLAIKQPDRFAAIAPICRWADTTGAKTISQIPAWVFHGAKDVVVPVKASEDMVTALKNYGAKVKLTVYPEANHDSWTETYNNEELYKWFLEQSLDKN